ncbi:hypothetical protein, partial [Cloacibacillus porcorum]
MRVKIVADFRVRIRETIQIVNCHDMRVTIYTSQAASVENARRWRAFYARSGLRSSSKKRQSRFFEVLKSRDDRQHHGAALGRLE